MKKVNFSESRKKLVVHWLVVSAIIFVVYFIQARMGRYGANEGEVWEWLFKYLTPPLTLMIGVLIVQFSNPSNDIEIDSFYFRLALGMSYFFLIVLFLSAFLIPVIHLQQNRNLSLTEQKTIIEAFNTYNNILLPLQGLSTLTLGIFFTKK